MPITSMLRKRSQKYPYSDLPQKENYLRINLNMFLRWKTYEVICTHHKYVKNY